ncbi:MAG TPA: 23S rRNA (guanosine(2251)-2'-O)-methyltransferase RlmB, partial [bacterium]
QRDAMDGLIPISGRRPVEELLRKGIKPEKLLLLAHEKQGRHIEDEGRFRVAGWPVSVVERGEIEAASGGLHHQGYVALVRHFPYWRFEDLLDHARAKSKEPVLIALDEIQDVGNLGAIIRSAECLGCAGAILPMHRSAAVTAAAMRSSAGAALHLPISRVVNLSGALDVLKEAGFRVFGADQEGIASPFEADLRGSIVLVIGSEGRGLRPGVKRRCDDLLRIPQTGRVESLNASAAAAILFYELARQRSEDV